MRLRPNEGGTKFHPFAHGNHNVGQQHLQPIRHAGSKQGGGIIIVFGVGITGGEHLRQSLPLLRLDIGFVQQLVESHSRIQHPRIRLAVDAVVIIDNRAWRGQILKTAPRFACAQIMQDLCRVTV